MFKRLNAMGEPFSSRIGQGNQRQADILFGHNKGGKAHTYLAGEGIRVGDTVTPEVTHYISGKTYKTLGRVVATRDAVGSASQNTAAYLSGKGIVFKKIGPTAQTELPGFKERKTLDSSFTTKQWADEADERYKNELMRRLNSFGE